MKYTELRAGNRVLMLGHSIALSWNDIATIMHGEDSNRPQFEPQPLTPDFVKLGGFREKKQQVETTRTFYKPIPEVDGSQYEIVFINGKFYAMGISHEPGICHYFAYHLEWCHQLQNAWHGITKTEFLK